MGFPLAYDPNSTEHREAAKRREEVREWVRRREGEIERVQYLREIPTVEDVIHRAT